MLTPVVGRSSLGKGASKLNSTAMQGKRCIKTAGKLLEERGEKVFSRARSHEN